ncbi:MAG: hypothetical protein F6K19_32845 [Cyanothece sp. SIO1E1]|nr:hypothetical protein [Cyanothece sp. SIO1E1]
MGRPRANRNPPGFVYVADSNFKRGHLPALPLYLRHEDRIMGLMFLLSIVLRVFGLMEFVTQQQHQKQTQSIQGLYPGNPQRQTLRPSAEQLLLAFQGMTL